MKKIIILLLSVLVIFGVAMYITNEVKQNRIAGNIYEKDSLNPATIKQLDDPNYQNQILPNELDNLLNNKEDVYVYFYQSTCDSCQATSPVVVPLAKELGIDLKLLNLIEFVEEAEKYNIVSVPTFIKFKDGTPVGEPFNGKVTEENKDEFESWITSLDE